MAWYALFVETGKEEVVQQSLRALFDRSVLDSLVLVRRVPERKGGVLHHIVRPLLPGYVLIKTEMNTDIYRKLVDCNRVYRVLRSGNGHEQWTGIPEEEIKPLLALVGEGEVVGYSRVRWKGSEAVITDGPLLGLESRICKIDRRKRRAKVALTFLGSKRTLELGIEEQDPD